MFTLDEGSTYWYPVTVEMTGSDGRRKRLDFEAEFERLPQDEINEMFRQRDEDEPALKDVDVIDRVLRGWRGVKDASGEVLEVNASNRARLLNVYPVQPSIIRAFLKSIGIEGKAKN